MSCERILSYHMALKLSHEELENVVAAGANDTTMYPTYGPYAEYDYQIDF